MAARRGDVVTFRGRFRTLHGVSFVKGDDGIYTGHVHGTDGRRRDVVIEPMHGVKKGGRATVARRGWLVRVDGVLVTSMRKLEDVAYQGIRRARETKKES